MHSITYFIPKSSPIYIHQIVFLLLSNTFRNSFSKLLKCEGGAGVEGAILPYVRHLQLISTLKIGADYCQLCQYKLTKPNLIYPNPEE